ncbi:putative periplasmic binding protein-like I [Helianthus annuus]|nr:putative periplasmic binding protein-like I [Helianthus annuus]KAJ0793600.1 putative periplasmic binding protein-like I [Helianthus annuus]
MRGLVMLITATLLSNVFSKTDTVNIGATLSLKSPSGEVSVIAMRAAVDDINSDPNILPGKRLNLSVHDANFSGFLSIIDGNVTLFELQI